MKYIFLTSLIIVIIIGPFLLFGTIFDGSETEIAIDNFSDTGATAFPTPPPPPVSGNNTSLQIRDARGNIVQIDNFLNNPSVKEDTLNPGHFILAGSVGYCLASEVNCDSDEVEPYSISYSTNGDFFSVLINEAPIELYKAAAERDLQGLLGIPLNQMCNLNISMSVASWLTVDESSSPLRIRGCGANL